jgi:hypothetical protein
MKKEINRFQIIPNVSLCSLKRLDLYKSKKKIINFFQNQTVVEFFGCEKRMKNKSKLLMRSYEKPVNTSETVFNSDVENLSNNITILKKKISII